MPSARDTDPQDDLSDGRDESASERADRNWNEVLQELRVMQTGTQILTGFLLALAFQPAFSDLNDGQRAIYLALVVLSALSSIVALAPVALHRMLFQQRAKTAGGRVRPRRAGHRARHRVGAVDRGRGIRLRRGRRPARRDRRGRRTGARDSDTVGRSAARDPCTSHERSSPLSASGSRTTGVAVAQFAPAADKAANLAVIGQLAATASDRGAAVVVFPEYASYFVDPFDDTLAAHAEPLDGPFVAALTQLAATNGIVIVAGLVEQAARWSARAQHGCRGGCERSGRRVPQAAPVRRVRAARVRLGRARRADRARDVRARRSAVRSDDLLRPAVPRGRANARRCRRRRVPRSRRVGARTAQGAPLAHAGARARDREHGVRRRRRPSATARGRQLDDRRPAGRRDRGDRNGDRCRRRASGPRHGRARAPRQSGAASCGGCGSCRAA